MDHRYETSQTLRKCAACYKKFNTMESLVEHMRTSYHSVHEPMCWICEKHCRSFASLRQHLIGPLPKANCEKIFKELGCNICLTLFASRNALRAHKELCQLSRSNNGFLYRVARLGFPNDLRIDNIQRKVVAISCKIVGGGIDGSIDLCARVCLIDEHERILFDSYVAPNRPITNYRYETSGISPEHMRNAMPINQVAGKIQYYICNGELLWQIHSGSGRTRILVGHDLDRVFKCLGLQYSSVMTRDTAKYPPLMDTNKNSNSLKYLTKTYLGYEIQTRVQDPYDDCVATMRLYMKMKSQAHRMEEWPLVIDPKTCNIFGSWRQSEFEKMTPAQLLEISRSDYYCWCLDSYIN
ncbi:RNA exonuclease 4-like [Solanum stenotomum]|uniref:RNA exonuclease 4-like n=1 Tax=Solanum stenotomum TaxID=172797 RepID=UPI0020D02EA4|nr:RNA exonuclease 4-like [Solanum stenotomum]